VVRDPGKQYALIGSILAITGLLISLFIRQRRIWVREIGGNLEIAGLALNKLPGLEDEISDLVKYLSIKNSI
jgi:cytochrome c biogenesis protein